MLSFLAPLSHVYVRSLPYGAVAGPLAGWCDHDGAAALISDGGPQGRHSYLMAAPDAVVSLGGDDAGDAGAFLRAVAAFIGPGLHRPDLPPFTGGLVGMASFEFGLRLENLPHGSFRLVHDSAWPELVVLRYPAVLAFDHARETLSAIGRGATQAAAKAACEQLIALYDATPARRAPTGALAEAPLVADTTAAVHEDRVAVLIRQIQAGDLFQANLARGWTGRLRSGVSPGDVMAALTARGSAPFGACLRFGARAVVSNSPERFIHVDSTGRAETRPIKGTRPRGAGPAADARLGHELLASAKDRAENLMIVDLMRHDLSRVSEAGSVAVTMLNALESYPNVHHLVSSVTARLRSGVTAADVLLASLPPGSVSGAPKVQAMKVISAMEAARGPYCGALFAIDAGGAMDSSVLIRTLAMERSEDSWRFRAAAGGGIVADSDPADERIETETKLSLIKAVLEGK